jgi:hypothetical protein
MAITKNKNEIRLKSGNNFKVFYSGAWITLGNILSGKLTRQENTADIAFADGESFKKRTTRMCSLDIVLAQVSKEILDTLDGILSVPVKLYYYNGLANSKHMEIYAPEAEGYANFDIDMKADSHQTVAINFSLYPQAANVSVIPNADLPSDKYATGASPVSGANAYYALLETTAV